MILSGHQPNYWPYPGLIGKIMKSDKFMFVTKVQFEKKSWQKRNRVRTKQGWTYIQVPTITKGKMEQNICDVLINNNEDWREKNYRTISLLYSKAPFYNEHKDFLDDLYTKKWDRLVDLDIYIMQYLFRILNVKTEILYDKDYELLGKKTEMLVDMCEKTGCDTYLSNLGSSAYVDISCFTEKGLNHQYINYLGEKYKQQFSGFEDGLTILDMLMNCGKQKTKDILENNLNYQFSKLNEDM